MLATKEYAAQRLRRFKLAWARWKYETDPEYRARKLASCKRRHAERWATDEAYREKLREYARNRSKKSVGGQATV
jgi:hypothetical protein